MCPPGVTSKRRSSGSAAWCGCGSRRGVWLLPRAPLPFKLAALALTLHALWLAYLTPLERSRLLGLATPAALRSSASAARELAERRGGSPPLAPCLVWVLLSTTHYQPYILDSIRQARMWNPGVPFYLLADQVEQLHRERPAWRELLALPHFNATVVDLTAHRDARLARMEVLYANIWVTLGKRVKAMMPTLSSSTNYGFTNATLMRLVHVHNFMRDAALRDVVHIENDQMVYGSVRELAAAARACGKDFVVARVGPDRLAASVLYASSAARGLEPLVNFYLDAISHGWEHASATAASQYVTDMSLTARYLWTSLDAGLTNVTTWPSWHDGTCLSRELRGLTVDGAILGTWCCGDFIWPMSYFNIKLEEFADRTANLWEWPFVWALLPPPTGVPVQLVSGHAGAEQWPGGRDFRTEDPGGEGLWRTVVGGQLDPALPQPHPAGPGDLLRVPLWNGTRVWNLHMHSKNLHLWRSDENGNITLNFEHPMGGRAVWWRELG